MIQKRCFACFFDFMSDCSPVPPNVRLSFRPSVCTYLCPSDFMFKKGSNIFWIDVFSMCIHKYICVGESFAARLRNTFIMWQGLLKRDVHMYIYYVHIHTTGKMFHRHRYTYVCTWRTLLRLSKIYLNPF